MRLDGVGHSRLTDYGPILPDYSTPRKLANALNAGQLRMSAAGGAVLAYDQTVAATVGGNTAVVTTPAANAMPPVYSTPFNVPALAGSGFTIAVVTNATIAAGATPILQVLLQLRGS
jgi:hypothetical protein